MVHTLVGNESDLLKRVRVRLLDEHERPAFDRLLEEKHYLHTSVLLGESLRYVAELDGQWVALIAFSAAALQLKAREQWLRWSPRQRARYFAPSTVPTEAFSTGAFLRFMPLP